MKLARGPGPVKDGLGARFSRRLPGSCPVFRWGGAATGEFLWADPPGLCPHRGAGKVQSVKLFLVRHAQAISEGARRSDEQRFLTLDGRKTARAVGKRLAEDAIRFDAILTSPLVRAVQTAELLAQGMGYTGTIESYFALAPGLPPRLVAEEAFNHGLEVAVVGHEPTISALGALLTQSPSFPPFRPGQVVLVERGVAKWAIRPDTLERVDVRIA
ncbi:MAG: histidine phosphatase family protein [Polyangiaceae bacterium]